LFFCTDYADGCACSGGICHAIAKQQFHCNRGKEFSVWSVPRCYKQEKLGDAVTLWQMTYYCRQWLWQKTHPSSRQRGGPTVMTITVKTAINIWSWAQMGLGSKTDWLTDRPTVSCNVTSTFTFTWDTVRLRPPEVHLTLNKWNIPFVNHVKYLSVIFDKRITWRLHVEMIETKSLTTFIIDCSLFKSEQLSANIKLNPP
jgi:hypothetical protein